MIKTKKKQKLDLGHWFIPHKHNQYRPHAFRHRMLTLYSFLLLSSQVLMGVTYISGQSLMAENLETMKQNVINLTNQEREKVKTKALIENQSLDQAAQTKLNDMFNKNYWDHTSPSGQQAWDFINLTSYKYDYAGENLARGFVDSKSIVNAWMNSSSHKKNLLNNHYQDIGVAVGQGKINGKPTLLVVQIFGSPQTVVAASETNKLATKETAEAKTIPLVSQANIVITERLPFLAFWIILFALIVFDGLAIRRLGLHRSKKHLFQFRSALLINIFVLIVLSINYVSIA